MKNSLFKRVAAAAAAVPLALTQCLTFSSVAAENDAVQVEGNNIQAESGKEISIASLLRIEPDKTVSVWNDKVTEALVQNIGTKGTFDASDYADKIAEKSGREIAKTVGTFLKNYVLAKPVEYVVNEDKDIVFTLTVTQPDWNEKLAYTPEEALVKLAEQYGLPQLETVDFSSVKVAGKIEVTVKSSALDLGTDVPVSVVFKPEGEAEFAIGELPAYGQKKLEELRKLGLEAIEKNFTGVYASQKDEATKKFNDKIDMIKSKFDRANNALTKATTTAKSVEYSNKSDAAAAVNKFLAKKNINKNVPSTAAELASKETVKKAFDQILGSLSSNAKGTKINITADQLAQFVDTIGSKSLTEADGTVKATDFNIKADKNGATFVGAFDDAEAEEVKTWVESKGYEYIGSYKKITSKLNFKGVNTFDIGDVDVQIERILVTNTTTTSETTTTSTGTDSTTTSTGTDSTTTSTGTDSTTTSTGTDSTTTSTGTESTTTSTGTESTTTSTGTGSTTTSTGTDSTTTSTGTDSTTTSTGTESTTTSTGTDSTTTSTGTESTTTSTGTDSTTTSTGTDSTTTSTGTDSTTTSTGTDSTTTSTGTDSTTTSTGTDSTTSSTDTTTSTESTTTTTVTIPDDVVTTSALESVYVDIESTHGFYLNTESAFDKGQIKKATLHAVYGIGYTKDGKTVVVSEFETTEDVTDKLGFGTATPANTYNKETTDFHYNVNVTFEGETIVDKDGKQVIAKGTQLRDKDGNIASVEAYIGLKGDANLDNIVDGNDGTAVLSYYAKVSTKENNAANTVLSDSTLVNGNPASLYDDFAAFLSDVIVDEESPITRFASKTNRNIDGKDGSTILAYYAKASTKDYKELVTSDPAKLWGIADGSVEETPAE